MCASADSIREIMIRAAQNNFDNGDYVFFNIDLFSRCAVICNYLLSNLEVDSFVDSVYTKRAPLNDAACTGQAFDSDWRHYDVASRVTYSMCGIKAKG
jgi:hypothetical protein